MIDKNILEKINNKPLTLKNVIITCDNWQEIRPIIKELQTYGLYYDVSSYFDKIYLRCLVNDYTQSFIESLL